MALIRRLFRALFAPAAIASTLLFFTVLILAAVAPIDLAKIARPNAYRYVGVERSRLVISIAPSAPLVGDSFAPSTGWSTLALTYTRSNGMNRPNTLRTLEVSVWSILLFAAAIPGMWLDYWRIRWSKRDRWKAEGRCVGCGYDLRASKGRCPECGLAIS